MLRLIFTVLLYRSAVRSRMDLSTPVEDLAKELSDMLERLEREAESGDISAIRDHISDMLCSDIAHIRLGTPDRL